jgi:hypothetical protein
MGFSCTVKNGCLGCLSISAAVGRATPEVTSSLDSSITVSYWYSTQVYCLIYISISSFTIIFKLSIMAESQFQPPGAYVTGSDVTSR